ncbi:MAG: hypothetical protein GF401_17625 [Chitinivibrionales bacterium]|nr:hypothetical protein [Chitinivibrionales bacterium]
MKKNHVAWLRVCLVSFLFFALSIHAQSLTDKLEEEETFYKNYGKDTYNKLKIERDVIGLYDNFGEHITDGVHLYELQNKAERLNSEWEGVNDSMDYSKSLEFQKEDFFEKFSNLVITQDAIGGNKTSFLIGDQITTKFTPLTFNKTNFNGVRFDWWSTGLQFSFLLSRTRPGFLAKKDKSGTSLVEYPVSDSSFEAKYYNPSSGGGIKGTRDFSGKSPFGDIDWLWSFHAQNTIANKVDVGLTYINHHVTDVKKGEKWFRGDVPDVWMPEEIHFEFSDLTPLDTNDAGVYVDDVRMFVNGKEVQARPTYQGIFRQVYVGSRDSILLPASLPVARPQSGHAPIIVGFRIDPQYWYFKGTQQSLLSIDKVKEVRYEYAVAGNYLVFVSTSKSIPLAIKGEQDPQTGEVEYEYIERTIEDIYNPGGEPLRIDNQDNNALNERAFSTTYFGQYIRKSPKVLSMRKGVFENAVNKENRIRNLLNNAGRAREVYNFNTYSYKYGINISSVTYGVDFRGELRGVNFNGEVAVNQREDKLPGSDQSREKTTRLIGTMKADREIGRNLGLSGDFYYISPDWKTNLDNLQASRYFKETTYKDSGIADYLSYPKPLSNNWNNIDDNDDNDAFVESDRRRYPSDQSSDDQGDFYDDGAYKVRLDDGTIVGPKLVELPTEMLTIYDDPDGVIASKDDRNRNGKPDFREDFLLFSSDPPVFELGIDLNNNGIPDYEDDDILPDFGHSVGYFITSNGIKTQGIRGSNLNLRWSPSADFKVDVGGYYESVLDHDLNGIEDWRETDIDFDDGRDFYQGKSLVGYATGTYEILKRSQGIMYDIGGEIRYIRDAVRNDAIRSEGRNSGGEYLVNYYYYIDPLNFRKALVGNVVGGLIYNNIKNFEYGVRAKVGAQKRFEIDDEFLTTYSFYDDISKRTIFESRWQPYYDRTIGDFYFTNRVSYRFGFKTDYADWRRFLKFFNRLEIIPQYKLLLAMSKEIDGPTDHDPRNLEVHLRMDYDGKQGVPDGDIDSVYDDIGDNLERALDSRIIAEEYRDNNITYFLNVPILRANYKIAENTQFEFGIQGKRFIDIITPEENGFFLSTLAQVVSRATYKGYNVTFYVGAQWWDHDYDVNTRDPVLKTGSRFDRRGWQFFAQIFSGT